MPAHFYTLIQFFSVTFLCFTNSPVNAQNCPANIDFENGGFAGWTCYTGTVASVDNTNVIRINIKSWRTNSDNCSRSFLQIN